MPINQTQFQTWADEFVDLSTELDVKTLEELRKVTNRLIKDPTSDFSQRIDAFVRGETEQWESDSVDWLYATLPAAYLRGLRMQDRELQSMLKDVRNEGNPLPLNKFTDRTTVGNVRQIEAFNEYPNHLTRYSEYENSFRERINRAKRPYQQSAVQAYRDIAGLSIQSDFINGNTATRRQLAQSILDAYSKTGLKTVVFPSGHRMSIEAFADREARAYTQDVAIQGQLNRATERGYELVRINAYAGPSPMCQPYQGGVYSINGNSEQYPSLESATFSGSWTLGGGCFHDYCGHMTSTYVPGVSEGISITDDPMEQAILDEMGEAKGNRFIFQQRQTQRKNEYQIRQYKRKAAASLDKNDRQHNKMLVRRWQARQREFLEENPFLKRNYNREQI